MEASQKYVLELEKNRELDNLKSINLELEQNNKSLMIEVENLEN